MTALWQNCMADQPRNSHEIFKLHKTPGVQGKTAERTQMKDESRRTLVVKLTITLSQGNQKQGKQHTTRKILNTITIGC